MRVVSWLKRDFDAPRTFQSCVPRVNVLDEEYRIHGPGIEGPGRSTVPSVRASF